MPNYNKVTPEIIKKLAQIVGQENVLNGTAIPDKYGHDAGTVNDTLKLPDVLVFPGNKYQIAEVVKLANQHILPITPRGGGSGLAGGAVPLYGGIVLDLEHMNQILKVNAKAQYMIVEPGVRTIDIQETANKYGFLYAGDPCSNNDCVIGGNVATNAGGNKAVRYGVTADQVYELEVITPQGEIVSLGGRLKKNSTGYGLVKIIAGSEGTLGIITRITLKLQKLAPIMPTFLAVFPDLPSACSLVGALGKSVDINPLSLELVDQETILSLERYQSKPLFMGPAGDCVIIQFEAENEEELKAKKAELFKICRASACLSIDQVDENVIWPARRIWGKALEADQPVGVNEDIVVPVDEIASFIRNLSLLTEKFGLKARIAGHAGDGNMHVRLMPGQEGILAWEDTLKVFRENLYREVYALGGRLSGEHGIGLKRKDALNKFINPYELELMRSIKKAFDPNLILNPGKIFDTEVS